MVALHFMHYQILRRVHEDPCESRLGIAAVIIYTFVDSKALLDTCSNEIYNGGCNAKLRDCQCQTVNPDS